MIAPSSAPAAGLGALAKPATSTGSRGMPAGNMQQIMNTARKMSDAQLAEVLSGKSLDVPQYVAMTEAMGRKQLRTAMQGAQAQQAANQPSIKEKLMGEYAQEQAAQQMAQAPQMGGIAGIPAPNMESVDMASGGIIAFSGGGDAEESEDEQARKDRNALKYGWENTKAAARDILTLPGRGIAGAFESTVTRPVRAMGVDMPYLPSSFYGGDASSLTPHMDTLTRQRQAQATSKTTPTIDSTPSLAEIDAIRATNKDLPATAPPAAPIVGVGAGAGGANPYAIPSYESLQGKKSTDYLSKLADLTEKQRAGIGAIKKQGGGEALMQMASGLLSRPTLAQGIGAALPVVASTAAATRKETRAVENAANDYDLNLAKAQEAAEKGDTENQLKYMQLANEAKYRADTIGLQRAQLNQLPDNVRTAMAIQKDPSLAQFFPNMTKASQISLTDAAKQWNDLPKENRKYYKELQSMGINSEQDYYKFVNGQLLSATIPGQGANIRKYQFRLLV